MALIRAIINIDVQCVRRLLRLRSGSAAVNYFDETGLAPVHYAAMLGAVDILEALKDAGADLELRSALDTHSFPRLAPPLHWAAYAGSLPVIDFLLDHGANIEATPTSLGIWGSQIPGVSTLLVAVRAGEYEAALHLLSRGADIGAVDSEQRNVLLYCVASDEGNDPDAENPALLAVMRAAVDGGVDLEARSLDDEDVLCGATVLHMAIFWKRLRLVRFLVAAGADANSADNVGSTPLFGAIARKDY